MPRKKTVDEVLADFRAVHGEYYDYTGVVYVNADTKITVGCPVHGAFTITPAHHRNGVRCRRCFSAFRTMSKDVFVSRAQQQFGDRYDYAAFEVLPPAGEKVRIACRTHATVFWQEPRSHLDGHTGCPACQVNKLTGPREARGRLKSAEALKQAFIDRAQVRHGHVYDYTEFTYVAMSSKGKILCPHHGPFLQTPGNHLRGSQCPACAHDCRQAATFKAQCQLLDVNYWRALKRREAGLPNEQIFAAGSLRQTRAGNAITVSGVTYPNLNEAVRVLHPPASRKTIARRLSDGMSPEEAFEYIPNPGYASGIIYVITHQAFGKQYVGLTIQTLERRWHDHCDAAVAGRIQGADSFHAALRTYGPEAFEIRQIDQGTTKRDLEQKERDWIARLGTLATQGYNLARGGVSGGAHQQPTVVDGRRFASVKAAAGYVAETRGISVDAAKWRLRQDRVDIKTPAKPGESLVHTRAYKVWSRIVHGVLNPQSKEYIPGVMLHEPWHDFATFYQEVGQPPRPGMAFTRLDKAQGFVPDNCAWRSKSEASTINVAFMKAKGTLHDRRGTTHTQHTDSSQLCLGLW